ncbi:MAG: carbohydrate-binding domain-containing protein [Ruminococcaceae bacterium]|nr:carbohydrate-binding domain-containing protein [Oscillospiraceae bacterium]
MKKVKVIISVILTVILISGMFAACTSKNGNTENATSSVAEKKIDINDLFTDRDMENEYDESELSVLELNNGETTTITTAGDYIVSGKYTDSQIVVDVEDTDKVQIVLNGVSITNSNSAAIYVKSADKVFITTAKNTENTLTTNGEFEEIDGEDVDGVIYAKDDTTINGTGMLNINTEYGNGIVCNDDLKLTSGNYNINVSDKAIKANDSIRIADGNYVINSGDDAIHSNADTAIVGGTIEISSGDDAIHTDNYLYITDGNIKVANCTEAIEGMQINISGGNINATSSDDGINAASPSDDGETQNMKNDFATDENALINVTGGKITLNTEGDGIDSNGNITVSGGEIYVSGPTNSGNGALDCNGTAEITGGTVVALGSTGMAENFTTATQGSILVNFQNSYKETVTVTDGEGNEVISFTPEKNFGSVLVSCPELKKGETYTITIGENYQSVTLDDYIYGTGNGMGGEMKH